MKIDIKQYQKMKEKVVTTSDVIKKSFSNVYEKLEDNDFVFASNQRNQDLVIMTIDNYSKLANLSYSKEGAFDGTVRTVEQNVFLTRKFIKENTYLLMQFESMNVTFPDIEYIANHLSGIYEYEEQVTKNLMDAWKYILGNYQNTSHKQLMVLNKVISDGQNMDPGKLRTGNTSISGTDYKPSVPKLTDVQSLVDEVVKSKDVYTAVSYFIPRVIKSQLFWDGNKRSAFLFANSLLIKKAKGVVVVNKSHFKEFNKLLNEYYNNENKIEAISKFVLKNCFYNTTDKELIQS